MSQLGNAKYSTVAMIFHWVIAVAVIVNWRLAEAGEHALTDADKGFWFGNHKALGITILVLTLARLAWRLGHKPPPLPESMKNWEKTLARTVHVVFYVMLIGLPIGGWLGSSYFGSGINWFGLFAIPALPVAPDPEAGKAIFGFHGTGGKILLVLVGLHVLGALKHTFVDKNGGLGRMWPGRG